MSNSCRVWFFLLAWAGLCWCPEASVRVLGGHLRLGVVVGFAGPVREQLVPQLADLLEDARFGLIGIGAVADRLVEAVHDLMHPSQQIGAAGETLFERATG